MGVGRSDSNLITEQMNANIIQQDDFNPDREAKQLHANAASYPTGLSHLMN